MPRQKVMLAKQYRYGAMGSLGNGSLMLIKQHGFPLYWDTKKDALLCADHDRILQWDYNHASKAIKEHTGTGDLGLEQFFRSAHPEKAIELLKVLFKVQSQPKYDGVKFTGYRVLGTVNRSNGYPVYSLYLYANRSGQKTYSDAHAPNVEQPKDGDLILDYGFE